MSDPYPAYRNLLDSGELARRAQQAAASLADCVMCARECHADRTTETGLRSYCRTGRRAWVSSWFAHHGEEDCLRGWQGSGTIFFSHCNLRCVFCQNYEVSWLGEGRPVEANELAEMMLRLQSQGCHNINLVTPSHVVPQILQALVVAAEKGLHVPIVYNTGAYDRLETLRLLEGVVDIYMPDFKFWDPAVGREMANAPDYAEVAAQAVKEMHRQVGDLVIDSHGLARRGLLVRHLVMPNGLAGTRQVMRFLAREISPDTYVNIMPQYRPEGRASCDPRLNRAITRAEWHEAITAAREEGLWRLDRRLQARRS
jgi:putative pyruvate formate lyase activating enzyme